jgi:HAE1 family hydrophobic/amphiphilic exporter-1
VNQDPSPSFFELVVSRPVAMAMIFLAACVFGWVSYARLPIELMPDISYPTITVRTTYEGAAPQEVESQISRPVEEALATLDGLATLESRSRAGVSDVVLGFTWGTDMSGASQSIRESLQTTFLPDGADRPLLLRYDPSLEPFLRLALSYDPDVLTLQDDQALLMLRELADQEIKRRLEAMPGVAAARVRGGLEREVRIEVREDWLAARKLTAQSVQQVLAAENVNLAGGSIYEGDTEYLVRTLNEYKDLDELRELRILRDDGVRVPITDVAIIRETHRERTAISHLDGAEAVEIEVFKEADANIVEVAAAVKQALIGTDLGYTQAEVDALPDGPKKAAMAEALTGAKALEDSLPEGVRLAVLDDQADFIVLAINNVRESVVLGGVLAVVILFLFLRDFRATAIIGIAIPVSVIVGLGPLYLWDVSLNLMSLGGLALGVGMLVDNAVVVLESIQRHIDEGRPRLEAARLGVSEVAAAVNASTLTTVAVFAPIAFVEGIGGELFGDLSLAVVSSLLASLAVALFLVPTLAARGGGPETAELAVVEPVPLRQALWAALVEPWDELVASWRSVQGARWRAVLLPWALLRFFGRALVSFTVVLLESGVVGGGRLLLRLVRVPIGLIASVLLSAAGAFQVGFDRFASDYRRAMGPTLARPSLVIGVAGLLFMASLWGLRFVGTEVLPEVHQGRFTIQAALPVGTPLVRTTDLVRTAEAIIAAHPDVQTVYATIGTDQRADSGSDEGEHTARIRVQLTPGGDLAIREDAVMEALRPQLTALPQLSVRFSRPALFSVETPLEVIVFGRDLDDLRTAGDTVATALAARPNLTDVRTSLTQGNPEVRIAYDRERLARFGLDTQTVASRVRDRIQGVEATEIHRGDQRLELRVQLVAEQRGSLQDLRSLNINPNVMPPIPLDAVADFTEAIGPSEIRRVDQQRAVAISANVAGFDMGSAVDELRLTMAEVKLAEGQTWSLGGQARELSSSLDSMQFALLLAVFLVYVIMASTFEHLLHPFVILFSVPLAMIGVTGGLVVTGIPMSVVGFIGLIVLAGVVVNNAIVLVDAINRLREEGVERAEAIREAAALRLRPILITTATTVLGLVPLALGSGAGAEMQRPLAITVIGGLTASTLLTLVVIPAAYALVTGALDRVWKPAAETAP